MSLLERLWRQGAYKEIHPKIRWGIGHGIGGFAFVVEGDRGVSS